MSHGARVIRTGVSSAGPAAPPSAAASSSAGSDAELLDGAYFRSCAGMLKVAQMVRSRSGAGGLGTLGPSRGASGAAGNGGFCSGALAAGGRRREPGFSQDAECELPSEAASAFRSLVETDVCQPGGTLLVCSAALRCWDIEASGDVER